MSSINNQLTQGQIWYREVYLKSEHWLNYRARRLTRADYECDKCSSKKYLQIHHLTYEHLWHEALCDTEVLCQKCHKAAHEKQISIHELDQRLDEFFGVPDKFPLYLDGIDYPITRALLQTILDNPTDPDWVRAGKQIAAALRKTQN